MRPATDRRVGLPPAGERLVRSLEDVPRGPSVVTVGFYDGVHRGHQAIIRRALRAARSRGVRAVALTFDRHPMRVVRPQEVPPLLMTHERRLATTAALGVDTVVALPFTEEVASLAPEAFVEHVLVGTLDAREVVVGTNFRFGARAAGDVGTLSALGGERGYEVDAVGLVTTGGAPISSTAIREHIGAGDVAWAARALGRAHLVEGVVGEGDRRGRELGVPTANVAVDPAIQLPAVGIYAGRVLLDDGSRVPAATSIGRRPTFGGDAVTVEAHLIDWDGDLYGRQVAVEVRHRLRDEERFTDAEALVAQMRRDVADARRLLGTAR